jgi:hypothetical protein
MVTLQVPVPLQAPLQPVNVDPALAVSVRVTTVPLLKLALQVLGQLMPLGLLLTEPVPVPAGETERVSTVAPVTVTVTMLEVELGYVPLPTKVAVTELAPDWSADPGTDREQVPALNVQLPSEVDPAAKLTLPVSAGGVSTYPVGVPPVTVAVNSVDWLEVMEVGEALRPVVLVNAVFHWVIRLLAFTVPMPVDWSKPIVEG